MNFSPARSRFSCSISSSTCSDEIVSKSLSYTLNIDALPYVLNECANPQDSIYLDKFDFMCLNVCGLNSKLKYRNIHEVINRYNFVSLSEVKTPHIAPDEFPGFQSVISQKKCTKNGLETSKLTGIATLIKENIKFEVITETICEWVLWLKITDFKNKFDFILGSVYIPGETSVYYNNGIYDSISCDMLDLHAKYNLPFIMLGDYNSRTSDISDILPIEKEVSFATGYNDESTNFTEQLNLVSRCNCDKTLNTNGRNLILLCQTMNLRILNGRCGQDKGVGEFTCHTTNGESTVDYIIVSDSLIPNVCEFSVDILDGTTSDVHSAISMSLSPDSTTGPQNNLEEVVVTTQPSESYKIKWKEDLKNTFKESFSEVDVSQLLGKLHNYDTENPDQESIDNITNELANVYIKAAHNIGICRTTKQHSNSKKKIPNRRHPQQDWFDDECESGRKEYMNFRNQGRAIKGKQARKLHFKELSKKHKVYKKLIKKKQLSYRINITKQLRDAKKNDPKVYWKLLENKAKPVKENNIPLENFKQHFQTLNQVFREIPVDFDPSVILEPDVGALETPDLEELNRQFTKSDIEKLIKKLKNGKSSGCDNILNEFLKNSPETVIETITNLFNLVLKTGVVPSNWCVGVIIPLFKNKGSINNVDNYRGITLLSVIGKLFTSALNERLGKFLDNTGVRGEEQAGFRAGYSTLYQVFILHTLIGLYLHNKKRLYCCFIDYSKAFDLIDRVTLWRKLIDVGVKGNVLRVIYNLYLNAKSCVKKGQNISDFFRCNVGVRQGDNLSPLLFAMYINDFESYIKKEYNGLPFINAEINRVLGDDMLHLFLQLYTLLYADDTIVLAESPSQLQCALNSVKDYCEANFLKINLTKTKIIIFSRGKIRNFPEFFYGNEKVEIVDDYIYLGVTINYNGSFTKAINKQITQARKAMFSLLTKARRLQLPIDLQLELFDKTVLPVLLYGCEVWGCANISDIEVFYRYFLKIILRLGKSTPNCMVYGETGTKPLQYKVEKQMLSFWIKVSEDKDSKIAKNIYSIMYRLQNAGNYSFPWLSRIKSILDNSGNSFLWEQQFDFETKLPFYKGISQNLYDCILSVWFEKVESGSRCTNYKVFKHVLELEFYLTNLSPQYHTVMSKFRCGSNKLPVNKYRFIGNEADKMCKLCDKHDIGDEYHYMFICSHFRRERELHLKKYFFTRPNTQKMDILFSTKNKKTLKNLAKFQAKILGFFN